MSKTIQQFQINSAVMKE